MEKTLLIGDYLLVDKVHYGHSRFWGWLLPYHSIQRQDIIVFRYPVNPKQHFVKRVVAVPGDRVRLINKHVYVNGVRQDDDYATFNWAQRDKFRDNFPDGGFYGDKISAKMVSAGAKAAGGWRADCPRRIVFRSGRQPRRQLRLALLGLRARGEYRRPSAADLLVDGPETIQPSPVSCRLIDFRVWHTM